MEAKLKEQINASVMDDGYVWCGCASSCIPFLWVLQGKAASKKVNEAADAVKESGDYLKGGSEQAEK